jgi:predicted transcriptional regulator
MTMVSEALDKLVQFFKALGDASRLRILGLLAERERSVDELATILGLKAPTVSHHLKRLKTASLVTMRREGNVHYYVLDETALQLLNKQVFKREAIARASDGFSDDPYETKVLETFIVDGRLTGIPAQRKKRAVILRYLVERFEPNRDYTEPEANEVISEFHPDVATLRRELVGAGLMSRDRGIYRREG